MRAAHLGSRLSRGLYVPLSSLSVPSSRRLSLMGKHVEDVLAPSLDGSGLKPIILEGYTPGVGFTVSDYNTVRPPRPKQFLAIEPEFASPIDKRPLLAETLLLGSIICTPHGAFLLRPPTPEVPLTSSTFWSALCVLLRRSPPSPHNVDLVLLGLPKSLPSCIPPPGRPSPLPPSVLAALKRAAGGKPVEVMDIGNAMATFNIMVGEGRNVVVALICDDAPNGTPSRR